MDSRLSMEQETELIIEPSRTLSLNVRELWQYRELFYFFTWRDIKVKYKQTLLGVLWVVLQPVLTVLIFSLFFGRALKVPSEGIDYPVFVFSGLLLWTVFSSGISNAGNSMVTNAQIIKKIYFPRLIIPIAAILVSLFDFLVSFLVFLVLLISFGTEVNVLQALIYWPVAILLMVLGTLGLSCWLAALNVKYRDFRYIIPFFIQALLFLTPVIYPLSIIKNSWINLVLSLNPMYGPITIFRMPIMPGSPDFLLIELSIASSVLLALTGIFYFRKTEAFFADLA
jgi:lipopolysaccharide transport system permease protein